MCLRTTTTTALKNCAWQCVSVHTSCSDCHSPTVKSCRSNKSSRACFLYFVLNVCWATDEVGSGECRHDCDEKSHYEDLVEDDHMMTKPQWPLFCIGFRGLTGQILTCSLNKLLVFSVLRSLWCRCLLLGRVARRCVGLCSLPVL